MVTDPLFGLHAQALSLQRQRMEVLASNLANADTPNFQARDLDFASLLNQAASGGAQSDSSAMQRTDTQHLSASEALHPALVYRTPMQPSADGNTVDTQIEQSQYADAALHYQASLSFIDGRVKGLLTAITGQ